MQKGVFWSGILCDNNFGGELVIVFDVLWNDFINNLFYFGIIVKFEDIYCLCFCVIVYELDILVVVDVKCFEYWLKKLLVDGVFVEVDFKKKCLDVVDYFDGCRGYFLNEDECFCLDIYLELDEMSDFVVFGQDYLFIKKVLEDC